MTSWPPIEVTDNFGRSARTPAFSNDGQRVVTANPAGNEWQVRDIESLAVISQGPFSAVNDGISFDDKDRRIVVLKRPPAEFPWLYRWMIHVFGRPLFPFWGVAIYDANTGRCIRTLPIYSPDRFTPDGSAVWGRSSIGPTNEIRYELWSLTPPAPPWWLWLLTVLVVIALVYNIRRLYWPNASTKRR
jgi:hypothetical protein